MNRFPRTGALAVIALLLVLPGCPEKEPVDERQALVDMAMEKRGEAMLLLEEGNIPAAQETFQGAYRHALDAVTAEGKMSRPDLLNTLAELCCQIGRWSPEYLGRAVRLCEMANEEGPGWGMPYFNLGYAYETAGLLDEAIRSYERFFELVPKEEFPEETWWALQENLVRALFLRAKQYIQEDRIGAEGRARRVLEKAFALRPNASSAPQVHQALSELNARHEQETRAAAEAGDGLEIAKIHARYGFPVPAQTALDLYKKTSGSNRDVRFAEARFVRELAGTPEAMQQAVEIYLDMMSRGEYVVQAAAGYGRAMLALGKGEEALERLADFPDPIAELRRTLILLRIDRISRLPAEDDAAAGDEFDAIAELMTGGLEVFDRAELFWATATAALHRKDADRLEKVIGTYQKRFPQDPRVAILDAELRKLRGIPVEEVFTEVTDE